jgi:hypothetical protein
MATKSGAKKGAAKKGAAKKAAVAADAGPAIRCLSFSRAGRIVQECSDGPNDIDDTLEQVGLITENQRLVFRECVFLKVLGQGCKISRDDIPNAADDTLRKVRDTISDTAQ